MLSMTAQSMTRTARTHKLESAGVVGVTQMCCCINLQSTFQHAVESLVELLHAGAICYFRRVSAGRARHTGSFLERRPLARAQLHGSSLGGRGVLRTVEDFQHCLRQTFPHEIRVLDPHSKALPPRSVLVNLSLSPCLAARE
jgi:hypothetical protein